MSHPNDPHLLVTLPLGSNPRNLVGIEVETTSLSSLGIGLGDVLVVEVSTEIQPDRLHAVFTDEGLRLVPPYLADSSTVFGFIHQVIKKQSPRVLQFAEARAFKLAA